MIQKIERIETLSQLDLMFRTAKTEHDKLMVIIAAAISEKIIFKASLRKLHIYLKSHWQKHQNFIDQNFIIRSLYLERVGEISNWNIILDKIKNIKKPNLVQKAWFKILSLI